MDKKKGIGVITGLCAIAIVGTKLFKFLSGEEKYSNDWMESLSDEELESEREKVRQDWCSAEKDFSMAVKLESILNQFDKEMSKRARKDKKEYGYPKHGEHGWYLSEDD